MLKLKYGHKVIRFFSNKTTPKKTISSKPPKEAKIPADITTHFAIYGQLAILDQFPPKLLRKKYKFPESYYIADREAAETVAEYLTKSLGTSKVILESNPGPGLLTCLLMEENFKLHLFESNETFLESLQEKYSDQKKRVVIHQGDLISLWKLGFQDREDNGTRVQDLLREVAARSWSSKPIRLFAGVGSLNFFKYLIYSMVRQSDLFAIGRFEMFLAVPPPLYIHLTCSNEAGYSLYRANTILFQIMFEYTYLTKIPRKSFLPWQHDQNASKRKKLSKLHSIDAEYLYLVKICPRANIYELCPQEYMQALLYFIKQNYTSRKHRVIPMLEKWAPGCGPRLIVQPKQTTVTKPLHPKINQELPQYSTPSTTISDKDFYPNMNIFTEFGDLNPSQMFSLFTQFRKWPEFKESTFLASLESSLLKLETSDQETIDTLGIQEEEYATVENETKVTVDEKKS